MNEPSTTHAIAPDQLFVIACPVCRGHVAANGRMCGSDACCPLCASLFQVPTLTLPGPVVPPSPPPPLPAEDWENVIETLAPPTTKVAVGSEPEQPSDFEIPPGPAPGPSAVPAPAAVGHVSARVDPNGSPVPAGNADPLGPLSDATPPPSSAQWIDEILAAPELDETVDRPVAPEGVPYLGPSLLSPADQDLEFRDPVRTVRHGDTVIEIRRLTPEERRARRFRRNLMMIVIGVSILMAIVIVFGVPTNPRR